MFGFVTPTNDSFVTLFAAMLVNALVLMLYSAAVTEGVLLAFKAVN